jgi:hypothetical protein
MFTMLQDIAGLEEDATKKKVGAAAARKQAEKLVKEAAKGEKEASKVTAELEQKEKDFKVGPAEAGRIEQYPTQFLLFVLDGKGFWSSR